MSLQGFSIVVSTKTCTHVPLVVSSSRNVLRVGKVSLVQYSGDLRKVESLRHFKLKLRHHQASSRWFHPPLLPIQSGYRPAGLQATSLQAITADDSSSGEAMGPSAHALSLSPDEFKHFLVAFFSKLQDGLRQTKERGLVESTKQGFQGAFVKLKSVDGKHVLEEDVATRISQGTATWQTLKPWVKWPLAIFISMYMVVTAGFGPAVSRDLIPLWILGPLVTGAVIRSAYWVAKVTRDALVLSAPVGQAFAVGVAQVFEDAKSGILGEKVKHQVGKKRRELKEVATNKRAELVLYVQSGQAANDFKEYMQLRFSDFYEWSVEKYEDFVDWWRPFMRAFIRLMKKLF